MLAAWKLLEHGASMYSVNSFQSTPFEMAVVNRRVGMVELLCHYGYNMPMGLSTLADAVNRRRWHLAGKLVAWDLCTPTEDSTEYERIFLQSQELQAWGMANLMLGYHPQFLVAFLPRRMEWMLGNEQHYRRLMSAVGIDSATSLISMQKSCLLAVLAQIAATNTHALRGAGPLEIPGQAPALMGYLWRMWEEIVAAVTEEHKRMGWDDFAALHNLY
jgi:hypothetical protein